MKTSIADGGVLFLLNSLAVGGSELKVVRVANALSRRGRSVHIAYLNGPEQIRHMIYDQVSVVDLKRRGRLSCGALYRLLKYLYRSDIRRIVAVNLYPLIYASLAAQLNRRKTECVAMVNTTVHRNDRNRRLMYVYVPLLRRAECVVFGSRLQKAYWIREYSLCGERCVCILNGVDTEHFSPRLPCRLAGNLEERLAEKFVVGTVGAMRTEKAHGHLLMVAGALRRAGVPIAVLLVGDGPCRPDLERCADLEGVADCTFVHPHADDVRPLLNLMDVFIMTSVAVETFSNAALEAMAMGKAVVLSDVGGAREMVAHDENGLIYQPGDLNALFVELRRLYEHHNLRKQLGRNARKRVVREFSFERMLDDYERLVLNL